MTRNDKIALREAEEALIRIQEDLENRVEQRTRQLTFEIEERKEAEKTARYQQERAEEYLAIAGTLIVGLDIDGNVKLINPQACKKLGYDENELIGKNWFSIVVPEETRDELISIHSSMVSGACETVDNHENELLTKSGERLHIAWNSTIKKDSNGDINGCLCSGQDISKSAKVHKELDRYRESLETIVEERTAELRQSEFKFRSIYANAQVGIGRARLSDGKVIEANKKMASIYGYDNVEEFIRNYKYSEGYVVPKDREKLLESYEKGSDQLFDLPFYRKDGSILIVNAHGRINREENYIDHVVVDITEKKKAEERMHLFLENVREGVFLVNKGKIIDVSNTGASMLGYTVNEIIGMSPLEVVVPQLHDLVSHRSLENITEPYELELLRKDGTTFPALINGRDSSLAGENIHISTALDISASKEAETELRQNERKYQILYHQSPMGMCWEDYSLVKPRIDRLVKEGVEDFEQYFQDHEDELIGAMNDVRILDVNKALIEMSGADSLEDFLEAEEKYESWKDPYWRQYYIGEFAALAAGNVTFSYELQDTSYKGEVLEIRLISRVVQGHEDDWAQIVTMYEDITKRKQAEEKLANHLENLQSLVNNRTLELKEAKEEAESANKAKSEFLAAMSHDLRTPLNAIMGFADMMKLETFGPLGDNHYEQYAIDIHNSGSLLISLINDVLDLSKIESGKYELSEEPLGISSLIGTSFRQLEKMSETSNLTLSSNVASDMPNMTGDERALVQVLNNLLSNAIKFTPTGGKISVSAKVDENNGVVLCVADTGIGMSEEGIVKALQPFEQADGTHSRRHEGTGLGLHLCTNFMKLFGGTLEIVSEVDKGTTIALKFPPERTITPS